VKREAPDVTAVLHRVSAWSALWCSRMAEARIPRQRSGRRTSDHQERVRRWVGRLTHPGRGWRDVLEGASAWLCHGIIAAREWRAEA